MAKINGIKLKEGVEIATLKNYDNKGFMIDVRELFHRKDECSRFVLEVGNWLHEFDGSGKIIMSHQIKLSDAEQQHLDNNICNFIQKGI